MQVAPKPGRYVLILQVWCCVDWWVTVLPGFVDMGWKRATYSSVQWILLGEGGHWAHSKIVQNLLKLNVKIYSHNVLKLVWTRAPWNSDCQWSMLSLRSDVFSEILMNVFIFIIIKSKWCCLLAYLLIFYGSVDISELYLPLPHHNIYIHCSPYPWNIQKSKKHYGSWLHFYWVFITAEFIWYFFQKIGLWIFIFLLSFMLLVKSCLIVPYAFLLVPDRMFLSS